MTHNEMYDDADALDDPYAKLHERLMAFELEESPPASDGSRIDSWGRIVEEELAGLSQPVINRTLLRLAVGFFGTYVELSIDGLSDERYQEHHARAVERGKQKYLHARFDDIVGPLGDEPA